MTRTAIARGASFARKALLTRRRHIAALAAGLRSNEDDLQSVRRPDPLDRGADLEPHDVLEKLQAAEAREVAEIDAALLRVNSGSYGRCEGCGGPVGMLRLRAVPEARHCMGCLTGL